MKILLLVMFALGLVSTHDNDAFKSAVHDNYQYYQEIIAEETTAVRINVFGFNWGTIFFKHFYENVSSSQSHHLVLISEGKTSSLASSNSRGYFYQRKVGKELKWNFKL